MAKLTTQHNSRLTAHEQLLFALRREEQRLLVRLLATQRILRQAKVYLASQAEEDTEDSEESEDLIAGIEALRNDLTTYVAQLQDRIRLIEQGVRAITTHSTKALNTAFAQYIKDDATLCLRDTKVALEGYDELIQNLQTISRSTDTDQ